MEANGINMERKPVRLPEREFLETFKNAPRVAVNLLITDPDGKVLLTRRNIPPFSGSWHFPGSFLLKNEPIPDAQRRVAKDEFGLELDEKITLLYLVRLMILMVTQEDMLWI